MIKKDHVTFLAIIFAVIVSLFKSVISDFLFEINISFYKKNILKRSFFFREQSTVFFASYLTTSVVWHQPTHVNIHPITSSPAPSAWPSPIYTFLPKPHALSLF